MSRLAFLLVLLPGFVSAASFDQLTTESGTRALLFEMRKAAAPAPPRLAARVPLGGDGDYLRTSVAFPLPDGRLVRVAGNKDRAQGKYDGYFMSFLIDGESDPYWVAPDTYPVPFQIEGQTYTVQVLIGKTGIFHLVNSFHLKNHPEGIRIRIGKPADPSFSFEFTAGELVNAMRRTGSRIQLGDRVYYASYFRDIKEVAGDPAAPVALLPTRTLMLLPEMLPQTDSKGNVTYKFGWDDRLEARGADVTGADAVGAPRLGQPAAKKEEGDQVQSRWAFHIDEDGAGRTLVVYDLGQP